MPNCKQDGIFTYCIGVQAYFLNRHIMKNNTIDLKDIHISAAESQLVDNMKVLLADDHPLIRSGIKTALSRQPHLEIVAEAASGDEALRLALEKRPDLLVLDVNMPGLPVDKVIIEVRKSIYNIKVLILTAFVEESCIRRLGQVGISGFLLKDEAPESLGQAVRVIQQGASWFSSSIANIILGFSRPHDDGLPNFNPREREVLRRLALGQENQEIAAEMNLAKQTVRNYIRIIYQKINVNSRVQAVVWARDRNLQ